MFFVVPVASKIAECFDDEEEGTAVESLISEDPTSDEALILEFI